MQVVGCDGWLCFCSSGSFRVKGRMTWRWWFVAKKNLEIRIEVFLKHTVKVFDRGHAFFVERYR